MKNITVKLLAVLVSLSILACAVPAIFAEDSATEDQKVDTAKVDIAKGVVEGEAYAGLFGEDFVYPGKVLSSAYTSEKYSLYWGQLFSGDYSFIEDNPVNFYAMLYTDIFASNYNVFLSANSNQDAAYAVSETTGANLFKEAIMNNLGYEVADTMTIADIKNDGKPEGAGDDYDNEILANAYYKCAINEETQAFINDTDLVKDVAALYGKIYTLNNVYTSYLNLIDTFSDDSVYDSYDVYAALELVSGFITKAFDTTSVAIFDPANATFTSEDAIKYFSSNISVQYVENYGLTADTLTGDTIIETVSGVDNCAKYFCALGFIDNEIMNTASKAVDFAHDTLYAEPYIEPSVVSEVSEDSSEVSLGRPESTVAEVSDVSDASDASDASEEVSDEVSEEPEVEVITDSDRVDAANLTLDIVNFRRTILSYDVAVSSLFVNQAETDNNTPILGLLSQITPATKDSSPTKVFSDNCTAMSINTFITTADLSGEFSFENPFTIKNAILSVFDFGTEFADAQILVYGNENFITAIDLNDEGKASSDMLVPGDYTWEGNDKKGTVTVLDEGSTKIIVSNDNDTSIDDTSVDDPANTDVPTTPSDIPNDYTEIEDDNYNPPTGNDFSVIGFILLTILVTAAAAFVLTRKVED